MRVKLLRPKRLRGPVSLRARVAFASAATAAVVVAAMAAVLFAFAPTDASGQTDRVISAIALTPAKESPAAPGQPSIPALPGAPVPVSPSPGIVIRQIEPDGAVPGYTRTVVVNGDPVAVTVPNAVVSDSATRQRIRILVIGVVGVALAAILGWFFAHRAVVPLRRLTAATAGLGEGLALQTPRHPVASETTELAEAMNTMLGRIATERRHTDEALVTARDFAATAAHELRTPLTAMRTDLQVLRSMPLSEDERTEILDEILTTQSSLESTLFALERLAVGDLTTESDWEDLDLGQLIDQVVEEARRMNPDVAITAAEVEPIRLRGLAAGLRSVVENAVTNAIRHGAATRVEIAARRAGDRVVLTVDDNGRGIPEPDRERVFERFYRASTTPGSGLGLALVSQQARLHGGDATIAESASGGVRLTVTLSCAPAAPRSR
ncbi:HAMP domain-containing sensor histidine kinase [Nocardia sp. CDC153]|uniref:sensor histidine kinase n=1 Tax=Nocardia sp. CDC153 TaxID=3112167 RepID=UPI002DBF861A|nr:HAMP domain-containing sensor histidine kinase [Nocardia sp. CDC153]MEC3954788.1 HAMP domain-containing sensor histidine kinase [Nocardia sp. CDC153]